MDMSLIADTPISIFMSDDAASILQTQMTSRNAADITSLIRFLKGSDGGVHRVHFRERADSVDLPAEVIILEILPRHFALVIRSASLRSSVPVVHYQKNIGYDWQVTINYAQNSVSWLDPNVGHWPPPTLSFKYSEDAILFARVTHRVSVDLGGDRELARCRALALRSWSMSIPGTQLDDNMSVEAFGIVMLVALSFLLLVVLPAV